VTVVRERLSRGSRDQPGVSTSWRSLCRLGLGGAYRMVIPRTISKGEDEQDNLIVLDVFPTTGSGPPFPPLYMDHQN
jgi:hypothetical protein